MNKKIIRILICILFLGSSVIPSISVNFSNYNIVKNKSFLDVPLKE